MDSTARFLLGGALGAALGYLLSQKNLEKAMQSGQLSAPATMPAGALGTDGKAQGLAPAVAMAPPTVAPRDLGASAPAPTAPAREWTIPPVPSADWRQIPEPPTTAPISAAPAVAPPPPPPVEAPTLEPLMPAAAPESEVIITRDFLEEPVPGSGWRSSAPVAAVEALEETVLADALAGAAMEDTVGQLPVMDEVVAPPVELPVDGPSRVDDLKSRIEETRRRIRHELEQPFDTAVVSRAAESDWTVSTAVPALAGAVEPITMEPVTVEPIEVEPVAMETVEIETVPVETIALEEMTAEPVTLEPVAVGEVAAEPTELQPVDAAGAAVAETIAAETVAGEPVTAEPVAVKPVVIEPLPQETVTAEPAETEPLSVEPVAVKPAPLQAVPAEVEAADIAVGEITAEEQVSIEPPAPERVFTESVADAQAASAPARTEAAAESLEVTAETVEEEADGELGLDRPVDYDSMKDRIETTRSRLKAKAFDAMMTGESALLGRDLAGTDRSQPNMPGVDSDIDQTIETSLREEEQ
jgi:hypothetical protein